MTTADAAPIYPPVPEPGALTEFYWEAVREHRLEILRCQSCGFYVHYPRPICNRCLSEELAPEPVSGRGTLYAYTVAVQPFHPYFVDKVPYVLAVVELEEQPGLRLTTDIVDCDEARLKVGLPVEVTFREVAPHVTLPLFRPA